MSLWYMFYGADLVGTDTIYIYIPHLGIRGLGCARPPGSCRCLWIFSLAEGFMPLAVISESWGFVVVVYLFSFSQK